MTGLDAGTYEILRTRLADQAKALAGRAEELNARRIEVFGGSEMRLVGTERIRTANNCIPRDVVSAGDTMVFGYNVFIGLRPQTNVSDVFSFHRFSRDGDTFAFSNAPGLFGDPVFEKDFAELYRYYKETRLLQLRKIDGKLLAIFQTGPQDIRVLRWTMSVDGALSYLDSRGERDHVLPPSHDFEWVETTRDDHVLGRHPHISIGGELFVETVGGDLTIKVENNTETGEGVYSEPVTERLQSLADADVFHARVGPLILLKIRPYKETEWRHLVFNTRTKSVTRLDGIGQACQRLPEDQGIIFPGGYYLTTGVAKTFETDVAALEFERVIRGEEDVLYVFHAREEGRYLLLPYNVIRKEVANPLPCHGYSLFDDGTLVVFRATSDEPSRVHPMQVWDTPFAVESSTPVGTGPLERIGNGELVRGVSDCLSVARMVGEMAPAQAVFEALIASCDRIADAYHWLGEHGLHEPLKGLRSTAEQVLDEFENVQRLTEDAAAAVAEAGERIKAIRSTGVTRLAELRRTQGHLVTLRERRYADLPALDALAETVEQQVTETASQVVADLQRDDAFAGFHTSVDALSEEAETIRTVADAAPLSERLAAQSDGLETLVEVVGTLEVEATARTVILEKVGAVLAEINRVRATLDARRRELLAAEGRAEFAAEFGLLGQAVTAGLTGADSPEKCDERLGRLLLQIEGLESRFGEFDDFLSQLERKREEVYEAFSARKQTLLDDRARRADRLAESADRILGTVRRRSSTLASLDEVNAYFAADPMVAKLRAVAADLRDLGDSVRADELEGRVRAARQEAGRALKDRTDLFDGDTVKLGRHRFAINTQPLDLTLVPHEGSLSYAITGTDYRAPVTGFDDTRDFWDQLLVSETSEVYRGEYLAASLFPVEGDVAEAVRRAAESRYDEGYERGVHDHDAVKILDVVTRLHAGAGLLRHLPAARAAAQFFWAFGNPSPTWEVRARSLTRARELFGGGEEALRALADELAEAIGENGLLAADYLIEELATGPGGFVTSSSARAFLDGFTEALGAERFAAFTAELSSLDLAARIQLAGAWLAAFGKGEVSPEVVALLLCDLPRYESAATLDGVVEGLLGAHPRIQGRSMELRLDEFLARTRIFREERVPAYRAYQKRRGELVVGEKKRLRLDEYRPKVMDSFVRNQLIDQVYLPLIGDNLAKQLDHGMGLLLLISPPGYGKTTLMEYVASRLGLVFVKVNGPALGHEVTSVDPADAPDATSRSEVEKISFALEMGSNVLLYLDDIQHTSPELLQKFISLCDAQRRMEGVWNGTARTYDLRGKRFAVCMAGNPYTESGQVFRVPDMLANRADVWNLGEVLSGRDDLFALSYIENALTANSVLAPVSDHGEVEKLVRLARGEGSADQLEHPYSTVELDQILSVLRKMLRLQEVVLANNRAYIASAAQSDASRTEPPFLLQGSYRNMNKLAQRVVPVLTDAELEGIIDDHYLGEAQTLTSGAESNLLKLAELRGVLTDQQKVRWEEVKAAYRRARAMGGEEDDPTTRTVSAITHLADRLSGAITSLSQDV
ncbi:DNA repair ATPase [Herbidospora sp. RD11066]